MNTKWYNLVFTEFTDFSDQIKRIYRTYNVLCSSRMAYHTDTKSQIKDKIFELTPIYTSVIYQTCWIQGIKWRFVSI